jgi:hypothetical protein
VRIATPRATANSVEVAYIGINTRGQNGVVTYNDDALSLGGPTAKGIVLAFSNALEIDL